MLPQETRKITNKQPNLTLKQLEKEEQSKPKVSSRKEIIKSEDLSIYLTHIYELCE